MPTPPFIQLWARSMLRVFIRKWRLYIFIKPTSRAGYDTRPIFKRSLTGLNSQFSFSFTSCLTKAEEPSLPNYLPIAGGRRIGFIPFPKVLVQCKMQSDTSRIWTRLAVSICYADNHYTRGTSENKGYSSVRVQTRLLQCCSPVQFHEDSLF